MQRVSYKSFNEGPALNRQCNRLIHVLSSCRFQLTIWMFNNPGKLHNISKRDLSGQTIKLDLNSDLKERPLGILWVGKTDKRTFKHVT